LDKGKKTAVISDYKVHESDTGSAEVQVALLTERIRQLAEHLKVHSHDYNSRRGLLKLIGRRRHLLVYLSREDSKRYRDLIDRLGLRK
jgi:small subunit ribosomal protein S15